MTTKVLDRSRKFGVVVGASDGTVHFQDGVCFGTDDREIGADKPAAPVVETPVVTTSDDNTDTGGGVSREELEALHPSQIKKLVEAEGLELVKGSGSKAKNIENLLAAAG